MKRDMDLIRRILIEVESIDTPEVSTALELDGVDEVTVKYHLTLLVDAGLMEEVEHGFTRSRPGTKILFSRLIRLTWQGHEFLDAARDQTRWNKAKEQMAKIGGVGVEGMKAILFKIIADAISGGL